MAEGAYMIEVKEDIDSSLFCDPCSEDGSCLIAQGYCVNCEEYLCENCYIQHRVPRPMRSHVLQDTSTMPASVKTQNVKEPVIKCPVHKDIAATAFSKSRNEYFCDFCVNVITERRVCSDIVSLETLAKDIRNNVEFTKFVAKLKDTHGQYKTHKAKCLERQKETAQFYDSITDVIVKKLGERRNIDDTNVSKFLGKCDSAVGSLEKWLAVEGEFKNKDTALFALMKLSTCELDRLSNDLGPIEEDNNKTYILINEKKIDEMLAALTLMESQHESGSDSVAPTPSTPATSVTSSSMAVPTPLPLNRPGRLIEQFYIKHSSEGFTCFVRGMVLIGTNRLLVSDDKSHSLKLINLDTRTIIAHTKLTSRPHGMTVTDDNQVYVTMPGLKKILHLRSPTTDLSNYTEIPIDGHCYTLAYHDNRLKCHYQNPCKLVETDLNGKVLRTIHNNLSDIKDNTGNAVISYPLNSYVDSQSGSMYVSCWGRNSIVEITSTGQTKILVQSEELNRPYDLVMDTDGSMLVCSYNKHTVLRVTKTGEIKDDVLPKPLDFPNSPYSLALDKKNRKLYIATNNSNILAIYQI